METISLSGAWKLRPLEREECSACTSYFEENEFLSYNNSNSIYTTLSTVVSKDELEKLRKLKWVIEREFEFKEDTDQRSVLLAKGALSAAINGTVIDKSEITELLKNGKNTIRLCVTSSFFSEIEILRSHDGIGYSAHLRAKEEGDFWHVSAALDYEAFRKHSRVVRISLLGCEREETVTFEEKRNRYTIDIEIPKEKVELWCLRGDGKQIMYTAKITVGNAVLERMIAFRKVEIKDGALYFNGRETFVMGALWPNMMVSDQKRYDILLQSAAGANMNALYIEEGHESHAFYNTCDRLGLIVIHKECYEDFTFHPSYVSGEIKADIFKANVREDAGYLGLCLDAIELERWTLRTRSDNSNHGVIYSDLLSSVREDGTWRPSHYAARRFFSDLVPILFKDDEKLMIYVSNDGDMPEEVELSVKFMTYSGQKRTKRIYNATIPAHKAEKIQEIDLRPIDKRNEFVYIKLRTFNIHRELTLLLDEIKECAYEIPEIETRIRKINSKSYSIRLIANKPAFAVHLVMENTKGNFSDSFFEVRPAGEKSVIFTSEEDMSEEDVKARLKIYDLASAVEKERKKG